MDMVTAETVLTVGGIVIAWLVAMLAFVAFIYGAHGDKNDPADRFVDWTSVGTDHD
jgi:hypothetical protein